MTTLNIRQKLMTYLADADDTNVKALFTILEKDMQEEDVFTLTKEQFQILEKEHEMPLTGQSKSYTWGEASQIIKGLSNF